MVSSYMLGGDDQKSRRRLAEALIMQGTETAPVQHWTQGLARVANALVGGLELRREDEQSKELAKVIAGLGGEPSASPASSAPASQPVSNPMGSAVIREPAGRRIYNQDEFNPLDAAVATPKELAVGVPGFVPEQYRPILGKAATMQDLPVDVLAKQTRQESGFNPNVVSSAGAVGISQFMPGTAREMGIDPRDPTQAIPAQAAYLRQNVDKFGGSLPMGLMAYNWGPGNVGKWEAGGKQGPIPAETQGYLANILGGQKLAMAGQGLSSEAPQPSPAPQQVAQAAPQAAPQATPQAGPMDARIQTMLSSGNPQVRAMGAQLRMQQIQQQMAQPHLQKLNDDTLFDPRTGRTTRVEQGYRPITDPAERARYGIPKDDTRPYQLGPGNKLINPPAETRLTVDQRGESEFNKEAGKLVAKRFGEMADDGQTAKQMLSDVETLRTLGAQIGTGKGAQVLAAIGPYAQAIGVDVKGLDEIQAYEAVVNRLAPNLRVKGSGAQSDFELKNFLKSLPSIGNTPGGNEIVSSTLRGMYENKLKASEIAADALDGSITRKEADKRLRELPDPMESYRAFVKQTKAGTSGTTRSGIQWSIP